MVKWIKNNYKVFIISIIIWFLLLGLWGYLNAKYHIFNNYLSKISREFIITSILSIFTTIISSLYQHQKNRTEQNKKSIEESKQILENNKDQAFQAIRRLEDMIDQQTYELRRLDDYERILKDIRITINATEIDYKQNFKIIENKLSLLSLEIERQKEQIVQSDKVLRLSTVLREDLKERELLKIELKNLIKKLEEKTDG